MGNNKKTGVELIAEERKEQIEKHGITTDVDYSINDAKQLSYGAMMLLAEEFEEGIDSESYPDGWDHDICASMLAKSYKDRLITTGALIAAEIDRMQFDPSNSNIIPDKYIDGKIQIEFDQFGMP